MAKRKYKVPTELENGKINPIYERWSSIHKRCKNTTKPRNEAYKDCTISEDWEDFNNFIDWHEENYYQVSSGETMCIDKDILIKNNKHYSSNTCIFVPQTINQLFESSKKSRGEYPKGVCKCNNKFLARCSQNGKSTNLGVYNTPEEAFNVYKNYKENYIKEIADRYKDEIPVQLYNSLYQYEVEITD